MRTNTNAAALLAAIIGVGCASAAEPPAAAPADTGGEATCASVAAEPSGPPAGSRVVCHLDCSGTQATGYGETEEAARADVRRYVAQNCRPEDGQHFIFCEPLQ